jgi:transcriptional regulator GlxA family with amidase domain
MIIRQNVRWVDEGAVVTAAGISAGIDMSLQLISRIESENLANLTAKQMEFEWTKNS